MQRLTSFIFSTTVPARGITEALAYRDGGYRFNDLEEINKYNVRSSHLLARSPKTLHLRDVPLESPWWWQVQSSVAARTFIEGLAAILDVRTSDSDGPKLTAGQAILQKALAQRDLFQIFGLVSAARERSDDEKASALADRLEKSLAIMLRSLFLTEAEYAVLVSLLPRDTPDGFTSRRTYSLSENYLPVRAYASDNSWMPIPGTGKPFRHFRDYRGRSFIKVYARAPELSNERLLALWKQLYEAYGDQLHTTAVAQETPAGLETMLVRTFGVFLTDGSWQDSFWPEEVIIRIFKYSKPEVDLETSDFSGTLFFQYKMSRKALLANPSKLGLRRTLDDHEQYYGFFGDVPDARNAYSDVITTMRANCISCHSELFYGLSTIFSFERDPHATSGHSMLSTRSDGRIVLNTPEATKLHQHLASL